MGGYRDTGEGGVRWRDDDGDRIRPMTRPADPPAPTLVYGLWDEERERWVRRGFHTAREAALVREEMESAMREDDDTNLQIVSYEKEAALSRESPAPREASVPVEALRALADEIERLHHERESGPGGYGHFVESSRLRRWAETLRGVLLARPEGEPQP